MVSGGRGKAVGPSGLFPAEVSHSPPLPLRCLTCQDKLCSLLEVGIGDRSFQSRDRKGARNLFLASLLQDVRRLVEPSAPPWVIGIAVNVHLHSSSSTSVLQAVAGRSLLTHKSLIRSYRPATTAAPCCLVFQIWSSCGTNYKDNQFLPVSVSGLTFPNAFRTMAICLSRTEMLLHHFSSSMFFFLAYIPYTLKFLFSLCRYLPIFPPPSRSGFAAFCNVVRHIVMLI